MTDPIFVDTNVLIYVRDDRNALKREQARVWLSALADLGRVRTNLQVLNELTRWILKNEPGRSLQEIREDIEVIGAWGAKPIDHDDTERAWHVRRTYGFQWFDCLLIAAACNLGCTAFLTEDMTHGTAFEGMTIINPFRVELDDLIKRN